MDYDYKKPTKILEKREEYPDGANVPTQITVHKCFCGKGTINYECVPGFGDSYFVINCEECDEKYQYIELCGYEWKVYK